MQRSVQALLAHFLDYAGMFPPARLTLEESLRHYLRDASSSPHAWMLGRFVCPAARLGELAARVTEPAARSLLRITALGQTAISADDLLRLVDADVQAIEEGRHALGSPGAVDMLELVLPVDALRGLGALLASVRDRLQAARLRGFVEVPAQPDWNRVVEEVSQALSPNGPARAMAPLGLKLRCGGASAQAFPGDEQVAFFLACCQKAGLPWKATAGLHHPHRFWDASLEVWHQGFLNVLGAGVLGRCQSLGEAALCEILADRAGEHFRFDNEGLAWKDWTCPLDRMIAIRAQEVLSVGSCSFAEPCQELLGLQLIDSAAR